MKKPLAIALPQGVRDILPEESARVASVEASILEVFNKYGFERVIPPILEFVEVLDLGLASSLKERTLKYIDPSTGRLVGIRPDITPQIARLAATRMKDCPRPLKLSYSENVIRYIDPNGAKATELRQIGAEYMTEAPSPEIDAEMTNMAISALKALGLTDFKIDIGDVGFVRAILEGLGISEDSRGLIRDAIAIKDNTGLATLIGNEASLSAEDKELLSGLTSLYGEEEVIEKALSFNGLNSEAKEILKNLSELLNIIAKDGGKQYVTIDLGEVRGFDYYTGIIIEGFASGVGKPILTGGRYDRLVERYGLKSAATGFAFDVERLLEALK